MTFTSGANLHGAEVVREGAAVAVQRLRLLAGADVDDLAAGEALGRPKRCKLAHAFLLECSHTRLELARLLGRHGVYLTWVSMHWKA